MAFWVSARQQSGVPQISAADIIVYGLRETIRFWFIGFFNGFSLRVPGLTHTDRYSGVGS